MNNKELANFLDISEQAFYKWRKNRPSLYKIAIFYKDSVNNSLANKDNETKLLLSYFDKLNIKEKEFYLQDMKTRILKKELDN